MYIRGGILIEKFTVLLELLEGISDMFSTWKDDGKFIWKVVGTIVTIILTSIGVYLAIKIY